MKRFATLFLVGLAYSISAVMAQPVLHLRVVKTAPETAALLSEALAKGRFNTSEFESQLENLRRGSMLESIANFTQVLHDKQPIHIFKAQSAKVEVADGEMMPVGLEMETQTHAGYQQHTSLSIHLRYDLPLKENRIDHVLVDSFAVIGPETWHVAMDWSDETSTYMVLARIEAPESVSDTQANQTLHQSTHHCELLLCQPSDVKTFALATPVTRDKAIAWLRKRSKSIHTGTFYSHSGILCRQENTHQWIHQTETGWDTANIGYTMKLVSQISPDGETLDLQIHANWTNRDIVTLNDVIKHTLEFSGTIKAGSTSLIEPVAPPLDGQMPVLLVTPIVETVYEADQPTKDRELRTDEIGQRTIQVSPAFERRVAELAGEPSALEPGHGKVPLVELLKKLGLAFPADTQATFLTSTCCVHLLHNLDGEKAFREFLAKHDLLHPTKQ